MPVSVTCRALQCLVDHRSVSLLGRALLLVTAAHLSACAPEYPDHYAQADRVSARSPQGQAPRPSKAIMALPAAPTCTQDAAERKDAAAPAQLSDVREARVAKLQTSTVDVVAQPPAGKPAAADPDNPRGPNADMARLIKLEYERECYRQAEIRARRQLAQLQAAIRETLIAVDRHKVAETTPRSTEMR